MKFLMAFLSLMLCIPSAFAITIFNNSNQTVTVTVMKQGCRSIAYNDANVCFSEKLFPKRSATYNPLPVHGTSGFRVHIKNLKNRLLRGKKNVKSDDKIEFTENIKEEEKL